MCQLFMKVLAYISATTKKQERKKGGREAIHTMKATEKEAKYCK